MTRVPYTNLSQESSGDQDVRIGENKDSKAVFFKSTNERDICQNKATSLVVTTGRMMRMLWPLVGGDQRWCYIVYNAENSPHNKYSSRQHGGSAEVEKPCSKTMICLQKVILKTKFTMQILGTQAPLQNHLMHE